ncbi:MAG: hypothetical protein HQ519_15970 [Planctomycetes bacterium]|nr:hypothetical protein [Planctomycetota bacterium]
MLPRKLFFAVVLGGSAIIFWPNGADSIGPDFRSTSNAGLLAEKASSANLEGRQTEPTRSAISDGAQVLESDPQVIYDLLDSCFQANDPVECLLASSELPYDRELFAVLLAEAKNHKQATILACVFLLKSDPKDALGEYSELHKEASSLNSRVDDIVLEAGFREAIKRDSEWRNDFADQLAPGEVFTSELSDIGVIMTGVLINNGRSELKEVLRKGLISDANGTDLQQVRAVLWLNHSAGDSLGRHIELAGILKQFPDEKPSKAAEMIGILLLKKRTWPDGDPVPNIQLVDQILSNPHWGQGLAHQIRSDHPNGPPQGISENQWETIRLGMEYWD